ncbi:MAG: guanylate kinase [Nitrospirae bacterium]|nr:guanylate kinase [Nitrospirota bacterium]
MFIVSAPSGAGKTTLCKKLDSVLSNLRHSVSYTTRPPRPREVNNRDYTFIDEDAFRLMIERGEFAEWARVHGQLYGTSKKRLEELLNAGIDVILDIDTQGAMQIKEKYKEGIYIFILPPSMKALRERLEKRMANSKDEIELRLRKAVDEIKDYYKYDYVIVNDIFKEALKELEAIIISDRVSTKRINISWIEDSFLK